MDVNSSIELWRLKKEPSLDVPSLTPVKDHAYAGRQNYAAIGNIMGVYPAKPRSSLYFLLVLLGEDWQSFLNVTTTYLMFRHTKLI